MRAAVPEKLGYFDLVCATNGWLGRNQAYKMSVFLELPLGRRRCGVCLSQENDVFLRFSI